LLAHSQTNAAFAELGCSHWRRFDRGFRAKVCINITDEEIPGSYF
jgi:hypothetical protein